mmetsp:Transcript_54343/g.137261  ORF Transcript_54343/g.137261 Transcript_54343/m.137261 type:complete len:620 (+) Transcript_54343:54-1913(+)
MVPLPRKSEDEFASPGARSRASTSASSPDLAEALGADVGTAFRLDPARMTYSQRAEHQKDQGPHSEDEHCTRSPTSFQKRTENYFHRPSSVSRLSANPAITQFTDWASSTPNGWDQLHQMFVREDTNPAGGTYMDNGNQGMRGIVKKRWVILLRNKGYPNDEGAAEVFDEILKESRIEQKGKLGDVVNAPAEPTITLAFLKRFERRAVSVNATLTSRDEQSPASRFVKLLVRERGSSLRAWRLDLDARGTGRVAMVDFTNACRQLGVASQGKLIWNNLRQDKVTPLEFHELDPKEASNLEDFAETLWSTVGFDLAKAWLFLDTNNQNYLSLDEFKGGVRKLGFDGDIRLIFKGLDSAGLGRMTREDFEYIGKVSRMGHKRLGGTSTKGAITDLITWVQRELGGAHELIVKIGLGSGVKRIVVGDLAARLTALGFEGDALQAAARAARLEGGTHVTADTLYSLLSGGKPRTTDQVPPQQQQQLRRSSSAKASVQTERGVWCDGVDNIADHNMHRCKYTRGYFKHQLRVEDDKQKLSQVEFRSSYSAASPRWIDETRVKSPRPAWNDNFDYVAQSSNEILSSHSRRYFSNPNDKPVRQERRALVEQRKNATQPICSDSTVR